MDIEMLNKSIVDRWFISFWGSPCNLAVVDELAVSESVTSRSGRSETRAGPPVLCQLGCGLFIFPHGLVNEKITVAITGALSGSVLLASVNAQLGAVGYAIAAGYVFNIFFALCLLCTLSVLASERLRVGGRPALAIRVEILRARYICLQFAVRLWRRALLPLGGKR